MEGDKQPQESFREYFRRAAEDPKARGRLLQNARRARRLCLWLVVIFGVLALGQTALQLLSSGTWLSGASIVDTLGFAASWLAYKTYGDRIEAMEGSAPKDDGDA